MVTVIQNFSPAQVLFLLKEHKASGREMAKLTLADLLAKKVLHRFEREITIKNDIQTVSYVSVGERFEIYQPAKHEVFFLNVFVKNPILEAMFKDLVTIASFHFNAIKREVKLSLRPYVKKSIWGTRLNSEGKTIQTKIREELELLSQDQSLFSSLFPVLGATIFLINGLNWDQFEQEQRRIFTEQDIDFLEFGIDFYKDFDDFGADLDGGFDSGGDDSGGDSGCGGCGGD